MLWEIQKKHVTGSAPKKYCKFEIEVDLEAELMVMVALIDSDVNLFICIYSSNRRKSFFLQK
jgi:hypothetical protein